MITLSNVYLGPIIHYAFIAQNDEYQIDIAENFNKQTYRNRCEIYGANGKLKLIIPLEKRTQRTPMRDIKIDYDEDWRRIHWKSLETAYRKSPFFEYYEDDFLPFYRKKHSYLIDLNYELEEMIKSLLGITSKTIKCNKYEENEPDYRQLISPKNKTFIKGVKFEKYLQVFNDRHGFIENLSIVDLLFNLGPAATAYLVQTEINS